MPEFPQKYLYSYEENEQLSARIQEIMTEKTSSLIKIKKLKVAHDAVSCPICKSHVEYFLNQLKSKIRTIICRSICWVIFAVFTLFWLFLELLFILEFISRL